MFENADNDNVEMFGAKVVTVTRWCDAQNLTWYTLPDTYKYITMKWKIEIFMFCVWYIFKGFILFNYVQIIIAPFKIK